MQRQIWKSEEDKALLTFVKQFKMDWNKISSQMSNMGFKRASKACRERYQNQLNPKISKRNWTQQEVQKLFVLQSQHGNKWTAIARQLPHRTDCIIKNYFYSLVRKVLRRLVKRVYGTKNSSFLTRSIKPCVLSRIFSANSKEDILLENVGDFSKLFKDLILKYKDFKLVQQIEDNDKERIKQIFSALQNLNDNYNENKIMSKIAIKPIKKQKFSKLRLFQKRQLKINKKNTQITAILLKIQKNKPIFTLKNYKIEQKYTQKVYQHLIDQNIKQEQQYQNELEQYQQQFLLQSQQYYQQFQLYCQQSQISYQNNLVNSGPINYQQFMTQEQMMMCQALSPLIVNPSNYIMQGSYQYMCSAMKSFQSYGQNQTEQ